MGTPGEAGPGWGNAEPRPRPPLSPARPSLQRIENLPHHVVRLRQHLACREAQRRVAFARHPGIACRVMGMRGLFNDHFSGTPGYYLYEEMPYLAKKSGITGRGLEGLTDAWMKAFGI